MKDEERLFYEDVREKAITARSARKRPSHSGCRLPQYTAKEIREMNGPTKSFNLNTPWSYQTFKSASEDIQKQYLKGLVERYNIGPSAIAKMFNVGTGYMSNIFKALGIKVEGKASRKDAERFMLEFCSQAPASSMDVESLTFSLNGVYSSEAIVKFLERNVPRGANCRISVSIEVFAE